MESKLKLLLIEDNDDDALLLRHEIMRGYKNIHYFRVETDKNLRAALISQPWDIVISDYALPSFNGLEALKIVKEHDEDLPFVLITGTIGEEKAIEAMKAGASDVCLKGNFARLLPIVARELQDSQRRRVKKNLEKDKQKLSEDLTQANQFLTSLMDSLPIAIYTSSVEDHSGISYISAGVKKITGYQPEDFTSSRDFAMQHIHPDDSSKVLSEMLVLKKTGSHKMSYRFRTASGDYKHFLNFPKIVQGVHHNQESVVGVLVDIDDQKKLEEQFLQAQKMESVGHLAGGIAHDFNNLLAVILMYADKLIGSGSISDPKLMKAAQQIKRAGERAASLTKKLLIFSRKQIVETKILNINDIIVDMEPMLQRLIGETVLLKTELSSTLGQIKADASHIEQVLMNLVVNARDAMPNGGNVWIQTESKEVGENNTFSMTSGSYIQFSVRDQGEGMDEATIARIFEPFFTTKGPGKGTGLGLSTVFGIVKQSGGHISVESSQGVGTCFHILLPIVQNGSVEYAIDLNKTAATPSRSKGTILLVEDEEGLREVIVEILKDTGYEIFVPSGPIEAASFIEKSKSQIELIISDVVMPDISGPELASRLMKKFPEVKVLFISGYLDDTLDQYKLIKEKASFLPKPFSAEQLLEKISHILQ